MAAVNTFPSQMAGGDIAFSSTAANYITPHVINWSTFRDNDHERQWNEYYRLWRGVWSAQDRDKTSERSRAIMPVLQQAVESAVAEVIESVFGRERWFDVVDSEQSEAANALLAKTYEIKQAMSEIVLMGALYGTGIGKIVVEPGNPVNIRLVPIEPLEFVIDPASFTIDDALGVAHVCYVPKNIIDGKIDEGIYNPGNVGSAPEGDMKRHTNESQPRDTDMVKVTEWHGLAPRSVLDDPSDGPKDELVESVITIANDTWNLKAVENDFDRGFISFQWDIVPRRFWGRGLAEKAYWPQKVLDAEIRSRIDALAYSIAPMMAVSSAGMSRGEDFQVRPGKNLFLNGDVSENTIRPINFPPPDPQTYTHSQQMQSMAELATGQLQSAEISDLQRTPTAGVSLVMGANIRRTKRTLSNIERAFLNPMLQKMHRRLEALDPAYPNLNNDLSIQFFGTMGFMAREYEVSQLSQIMGALPDGPAKLLVLNQIVDHLSFANKDDLKAALQFMVAQSLQPQQPGIEEQAAMMRAEASMITAQAAAERNNVEILTQQLLDQERRRDGELGLTNAAISAARDEAKIERDRAEAIKAIAEAQATAQNTAINELKTVVDSLVKIEQTEQAAPAATESGEGPAVEMPDLSEIMERLAELEGRESSPAGPIEFNLQRDERGLIQSVNGQPVTRDGNGLLSGISQ